MVHRYTGLAHWESGNCFAWMRVSTWICFTAISLAAGAAISMSHARTRKSLRPQRCPQAFVDPQLPEIEWALLPTSARSDRSSKERNPKRWCGHF